MRKLLLLLTLCALSWSVMAQNRTISGRVTDDKGTAVSNASVTVKGTPIGTTTDGEGRFSLNIPTSANRLTISYVGFTDKEISLTDTDAYNITLSTTAKDMQEVVVVAYGTQSRREVTSAISIVDEQTIKRQQVTSVTQALQGTAPGVVVINTSGQPGDNPTIRIRGIGSVNASSDPLIVLDGIPFDGNINMINPNDIENFSILKDAPATALYGSRAANGVVLITTKSGRRNQQPLININSVYGNSARALPEYEFVNGREMYELGWEALRNTNAGNPNAAQLATEQLVETFRYNPFNVAQPVGADGKLVAGADLLWNTDWTKELTRTNAARKDLNMNISGGTEKARYFFSGGYLKQEGYLITSNFDRITARFNYTNDLKDWLQVGARTAIVSSNQNYPSQATSSFENVVQYIRTMSSIYPVYKRGENGELLLDANGQPIWDFGKPDPARTVNVNRNTLQPSNLVATTLVNDESRDRLQNNLNLFGEVKFTPALRFRSSFGIDRYHFNSMSYQNPEFGLGENVGGRITRQQDLTTSWTFNNMANYSRRFGVHNIDLMGSVEAYKYALRTQTGQKVGFPFGGLREFNSAATTEALTGSSTSTTINSYLGRAKYDFKSKYFIEGTVRWDASSRFAPENRWGFFPAVGVSWVLSEEDFIRNMAFINVLKFRASYGRLGNEGLTSRFPYLSTFSTGYDQLNYPGVYLDQLGNEDLRWEKQGNFNVGLDFTVLNNRLNGSVDYFDKRSIDLLFSRPLVFSGGIPSVDYNIGEISNRGIEFALNGTPVRTKNFTWDVSFNMTKLTNEITKLTDKDTLAPAGSYRFVVGKSRYEFYLPEWAGVNPEDGSPMWYKDEVDANGNPTGKKLTVKEYEEATRHWVGTGVPKLSGGLSQRFNYRGFDLSFLFNFSFGSKYYDVNYAALMHGFTAGFGTQMHKDIVDRWQQPGDITNVPILDENNTDITQLSTRFLFDGDYIRLRNVTLGYNYAPRNSTSIVKGARLFVQADNYFTWSKLIKGADPEADISGAAAVTSSVFKTASVGIEITF